MFSPPAIIVHGLDDARAALRPGLAATLLSAPGAALYAGCLWWRAVVAAAAAEYPATPVVDLLDCADAPGQAMAALRAGCRALVLDPACPAYPRVHAAAAAMGAVVLPAAPEALDLADPGNLRRVEAWLAAPQRDRSEPVG
ncbi:MAG TPA: hypothetical protein VGC80_16950 [Acetobacteraceae bacterium]|jgi:hypothetical protein